MKMTKSNFRQRPTICKLTGLTIALCLLLSACGGGASAEPPDDYVIGDDLLPALTKVVPLGEQSTFSQEGDGEEQPFTYHYGDLESGSTVVSTYVDSLVEVYGCSVLDEENRETTLSSLSEEGTVRVGIEGVQGDGIFVLDLQWDNTSCTVIPKFEEGAEIRAEEIETLSMAEALLRLEDFAPQELGLEGEDMSRYTIYPSDGIVMVNDEPCFQMDVYLAENHQFEGSYMVSATGEHIYQLDRTTGQAAEVGRH